MMPSDVLLAVIKLGLLLFTVPTLIGFIIGAVKRESGKKYARWPGWIYCVVLEIAVLVDKGFPFLWANLVKMVVMTPPPEGVIILIGLVLGVINFFILGSVSWDGYKLAARVFGFRNELSIKGKKTAPKKKKADEKISPASKSGPMISSKKKKRR